MRAADDSVGSGEGGLSGGAAGADGRSIDGDLFVVVINHEDPHALRPARKAVPEGRKVVREAGSRADCLAFIEANWTDMRPASAACLFAQPRSQLHRGQRVAAELEQILVRRHLGQAQQRAPAAAAGRRPLLAARLRRLDHPLLPADIDPHLLRFVAKEAWYKAEFPGFRQVLDFLVVRIVAEVSGAPPGCASFEGSAPAHPQLGASLRGRFLRTPKVAAAVCWAPCASTAAAG